MKEIFAKKIDFGDLFDRLFLMWRLQFFTTFNLQSICLLDFYFEHNYFPLHASQSIIAL